MTEQQIITAALSAALSDNGKITIYFLASAYLVKKFLPSLIAWIVKKCSQTVKDFFKGIDDIKAKQFVLEAEIKDIKKNREASMKDFNQFQGVINKKVDELDKKLDKQIESTDVRFKELKKDLQSVKEHEQKNSDDVLNELKELNGNFAKYKNI